jgi:hypothetical protein
MNITPAVGRSICVHVRHPFGEHDHILITVRQLRFSRCGAPSPTGGRMFVPVSQLFPVSSCCSQFCECTQRFGLLIRPTELSQLVTSSTRLNMQVQSICQSRPGIANHAITHVAQVTTAAKSMERPYALRSPNMCVSSDVANILHFRDNELCMFPAQLLATRTPVCSLKINEW